jgi:hypothetical protein
MVLKRKNDAMQQVSDSVRGMDLFRGDSESGLVAASLVRHTLSEMYVHEYPEKKWINGQLVHIRTEVPEGSDSFQFLERSRSGKSAIVGPNPTDVPQADISGGLTIRPIRSPKVFIEYTTQDIRRIRLQGMGMDIAQDKAIAAREANDDYLDELIRIGSAQHGMYGMTNHPGIQIDNAATGTWQGATAAQIIQDHRAAINPMISSSGGVVMPDTIVYDTASYTRVSTLDKDTQTSATVLEFLKKAFPSIKKWEWDPGLDTASNSGGPATLIYRRRKQSQFAVMPMPMKPLPPQPWGYGFRIYFETEFGGVAMPKPRDLKRLDGV